SVAGGSCDDTRDGTATKCNKGALHYMNTKAMTEGEGEGELPRPGGRTEKVRGEAMARMSAAMAICILMGIRTAGSWLGQGHAAREAHLGGLGGDGSSDVKETDVDVEVGKAKRIVGEETEEGLRAVSLLMTGETFMDVTRQGDVRGQHTYGMSDVKQSTVDTNADEADRFVAKNNEGVLE
ncbi:hypothetical protein TrRE_jg4913, partial [Triparma retinervis]